MAPKIRVAIAHDYLTQRGGAERVVLAMARAFPGAPIFTTLYDADQTFSEFRYHDVRSLGLNRSRWARTHHRALLPVLPLMSEAVHIDADVVIASSSGWSHGFHSTGKKVVYCYSPARWLYQSDAYLGSHSTQTTAFALRALGATLRRWDRRAAASADRYIAISSAVRERVADAYGIDCDVIPAPYTLPTPVLGPLPAGPIPDKFFLCVARLLPYKNVGAIVSAFRGRSESLVVVGKGPELQRLRSLAGPNITFLADLPDQEMTALYSRCRAVVAASYEDYGLTPVEAAVAGRPSIVLRWGGFLDTVLDRRTGVFFDDPSPAAIGRALDDFHTVHWDDEVIKLWSTKFGEEHFARRLHEVVDATLGGGELSAEPVRRTALSSVDSIGGSVSELG